MTPRIQQNITPRRHQGLRVRRNWNIQFTSPASFAAQRGSVDHATVTVAFGLLALLLVGFLGFFYLQQVIGTASQGTDVHALEAQIVDLKEKQRQLELEGAELRSLRVVEDKVNELNLVATDRVSYLASSSDRVAALSE